MKLSDLKLLSMLPLHMQSDKNAQGFVYAIENQLQTIILQIAQAQIYARIDSLTEEILDELAWQLSADWYDRSAALAVKREAIKNALIIHQTRGTPYAVEQLCQIFFGSAEVTEWFDYGGDPYKFKVTSHNRSLSEGQADAFLRALDLVKNVRSELEALIIHLVWDELKAATITWSQCSSYTWDSIKNWYPVPEENKTNWYFIMPGMIIRKEVE